jgi:hypothetical protein
METAILSIGTHCVLVAYVLHSLICLSKKVFLSASVPESDPDPLDPYVLGLLDPDP